MRAAATAGGGDGVGPPSRLPGGTFGDLMPIWPGTAAAYITMDFATGAHVVYSSLPKPGTDQPYFLVGGQIDHFEGRR